MIQWLCEACNKSLTVAEQFAGHNARCQHCGKIQIVPPINATAPSVATTIIVADPLDREAAEHDSFARSRLGIYVGREAYFQQLDAFASTPGSDGTGLVVLGAPGAGKSALLANWLNRYRAAHPGGLVLAHFIGPTPHGTWSPALVRRILGEFRRHLNVSLEMPDRPDELRPAFASGLAQAAARGKVVLVLNALDQLVDRDGGQELSWLPPELPANVRLIVSTLPGRPLEELTRRRWSTLAVQPLTPDERRRLVTDYLHKAGRSLAEQRLEQIIASEQSANPLFLRSLLAELCLSAHPDQVDQRLPEYLALAGPRELFARLLQRYEADFERDRPGLVRQALTSLWGSRRGLTEKELLHLLGNPRTGEPLPPSVWAPLRMAAGHTLINRSGELVFSHATMRQAVAGRYLTRPEDRTGIHWRLAAFFRGRGWTARTLEELPWQLARAQGWEQLYRLLCDPSYLQPAWQLDEFEVKAYWRQVELYSPYRMADGYRLVLQDPASYVPQLGTVASLLEYREHYPQARTLRDLEVEQFLQGGDRHKLLTGLRRRALLLQKMGDLEQAQRVFQEAEILCRQLGDLDALQANLGSQEALLRGHGDLDGAVKLLKEREGLCRQLGLVDNMAQCLINQGGILRQRGDLDGALTLQQQAERICRQAGHLKALSYSLAGQALIRMARSDLEGALPLLEEQERLCRQLDLYDGLLECLSHQAQVWQERGNPDRAEDVLEERVRLCRQLDDGEKLAEALVSQASLLGLDQGQGQAALPLLEEAMQLTKQYSLDELGQRVNTLRGKLEQQRRTLWGRLKGLVGR